MKAHRPGWVLAIFFATGIGLGYWCPWLKWWFAASALVALLLKHWPIAVIAAGALLMTLHQHMPLHPKGYAEGVIVSDIKEQQWANGVKRTFTISYAEGLAQGEYYGLQALAFGDRIIFEGKWFRGPKKFQGYDDIHGKFWKVSIGAKDFIKVIGHDQGNPLFRLGLTINRRLKEQLALYLPEASAATVIAMVLGERAAMPKETKNLFVRSGTAHILAISGMNMAVVAAMFLFVMKLMGLHRRWQMSVTIMILWLYALASGLSASVVRACVMASIVLGGFAFDEEGEPLNSLGIAACVLLAIDPGNLLDIGFQLSFAAVAGILLLTTSISQQLSFLPSWLAQSLAVSAAATTATAPILYYHFGTITPIAIISNILIVPLADIIFLLGLSLAIAGIALPIIANSLASCVNGLFHLLVWLAYFFSQIPGGHWKL